MVDRALMKAPAVGKLDAFGPRPHGIKQGLPAWGLNTVGTSGGRKGTSR